MKYMRRTVGYTWTDYKINTQITKKLKITQILDKLLEYKRNWIQHVNRMPRNRLSRVMKHYSPTGRRNHGRPLKRLLVTWDRNQSTSGPPPWQIYDDNDDDGDDEPYAVKWHTITAINSNPTPDNQTHTYLFTRQIPFNPNDGGVGCLRNVGRLPFYRTTWRDVPEDPNLSIHRDENLRHRHKHRFIASTA